MEEHGRIRFTTPDIEHEREFIEQYIVDAVDRLPDQDICEKFIFVRAGHDPTMDDGGVIVDVYGDPAAIVSQERLTYDEFVVDGLLTDWEQEEVDLVDSLADWVGDEGVALHEELRFLASKMSGEVLTARDQPPAPVDEYPGQDVAPVGWYRLLHILSNHQGYTHESEIDAYVETIAGGLDARAQSESVDAAQEQAEEIIGRLESIRSDLDQHRE